MPKWFENKTKNKRDFIENFILTETNEPSNDFIWLEKTLIFEPNSNRMLYNWELDDWPDFKYDLSSINSLIYQFIESTGRISGMVEGFSKRDKIETIIDMMVNEAMKTSEIEDEHLHEDSVRKSVMKNLGFEVDEKSIRDVRAIGMVEVMNQVRKDFNKRLTKQTLFNWHQAVMKGQEGEMKVGFWRKSKISMQIISGP